MFDVSSEIRNAGRQLRAAMPVTPPPRINVLVPQAGPQPLNITGGPA